MNGRESLSPIRDTHPSHATKHKQAARTPSTPSKTTPSKSKQPEHRTPNAIPNQTQAKPQSNTGKQESSQNSELQTPPSPPETQARQPPGSCTFHEVFHVVRIHLSQPKEDFSPRHRVEVRIHRRGRSSGWGSPHPVLKTIGHNRGLETIGHRQASDGVGKSQGRRGGVGEAPTGNDTAAALLFAVGGRS
jgi:hypothetical protein